MAITLGQTTFAVAPNCKASFLASGGTGPYTYSVLAGGAGGSIDSSTGAYVAPAVAQSSGPQLYDTIKAVDSLSVMGTAKILVGYPILLLWDILWREMGLTEDRVYFWDQKLFQPKDADIYAAISVPDTKAIASVNRFNPTTQEQEQFVSMRATVGVDIISRGPAARDRKEDVLLALNSNYSRFQQAANSFGLAKIPTSFVNLSNIDGAAIPYRYRINFGMFYAYAKSKASQYYDTFPSPTVVTDP